MARGKNIARTGKRQEGNRGRVSEKIYLNERFALNLWKFFYAPSFVRASKKLATDIKAKADSAIEIFRNDPADTRLRVHKLRGRFCNYWAFSVDFKYRIMFLHGQAGEVILMFIGDHGIYD